MMCCLFIAGNTNDQLKEWALPTLNMPIKSHSIKKSTERRKIIKKDLSPYDNSSQKSFIYLSFKELTDRTQKLKLSGWSLACNQDRICLKMIDPKFVLPKLELFIDDSLEYSISVYGWLLPPEHPFYTKNKHSLRQISVSSLIKDLENYTICNGLSVAIDSQHTINHVIPKVFDPLFEDETTPYHRHEYCRSLNCQVLYYSNQCDHCGEAENYATKVTKRNSRKFNTPAKLNAPISKTSPGRIKLTLQEQRLKCQQLEDELNRMRNELSANSVAVDNELNSDFMSILDGKDCEMTPFMELFWQEQKKMFLVSKHGTRLLQRRPSKRYEHDRLSCLKNYINFYQ